MNYLEQHAKDKYIKTIVDDEAEIIKIDDNEALRKANAIRKASLKEAKIRLAGRCDDVREMASEVEASTYHDCSNRQISCHLTYMKSTGRRSR